jgi:Domain of unknown function (DUF932)
MFNMSPVSFEPSRLDHAFGPRLSLAQLQQQVPAAFATEPDHSRTSAGYAFISTRQLLDGLMQAGFEPTTARQTRARGERAGYARHLIRLRHVRESVTMVDAIPDVALSNSHDGTSSYALRAGMLRPVCTNGLLTRIGDFGLIHLAHRGDVVANVVEGALALTRGFATVGALIERMAATRLDEYQRRELAHQALGVRYQNGQHIPIEVDRVLLPRRAQDQGSDLWRVFNAVQENITRGGVAGVSATGRATRSREIRAIREEVRVNDALWQLAVARIDA